MDTAKYLEQYLEVRGVQGTFLLSRDGMLMEKAIREGWYVDGDVFAAGVAQIAAACQELGGLLKSEGRSAIVEYDGCLLVLQALPEADAYVAMVAEPGVNLGLLRLHCTRLRKGLVAVLDPMAG